MKVKTIILVAAVLLMIGCATPVHAADIPPLPHAFYGTLKINNSDAPISTTVEARGTGVTTGITGNPIVTTQAGRYGSADPLGAKLVVQGNITDGATLTFYVNGVAATPTAGWHSGETTKLDLTATITQTFTITASPGAGGTISPSGSVSVNYGASQSFTITPNAGYVLADVLVDGVSVGAVTSYTFTNVTANHTITASFSATGGGGGGGAAPAPITGSGTVSFPSGLTTSTVTLNSQDGVSTATIPQGTTVKDALGNPLGTITCVLPAIQAPVPPAQNALVMYDFGPTGATFSPDITITMKYDPAKLPTGVSESSLVIAYYDTASSQWVNLTGIVVDPVNHTVSGKTGHFSQFAVLANLIVQPVVTPTPTSIATPTPTKSPSPTVAATPTAAATPSPSLSPTPTPTAPFNWILWIIIAVVVIAILVVVYLWLVRWRY